MTDPTRDDRKPLTVRDLVAHLLTLDQDLPVAFEQYSDYTELELRHLTVKLAQVQRGDGYVGIYRRDKEARTWLIFPGN